MKALVTGGGGFLGGRIAAMLQERGDDVTILGRGAYPKMVARGFRAVQADVRDEDAMVRACRGMEIVFHAAAIPGIWGRFEDHRAINTTGTLNVIRACREGGVPRLVHTSTPSVAFGNEPVLGVDESIGYADRYLMPYAQTKADAERAVIRANDDTLATVALRPHLVWGPGDPHLMPRVVSRARRGRLVQVGDGRNRVDITYIDTAALGHLRAGDELAGAGRCAGRAYFISQGEPLLLWHWIAGVLEALGVPPVRRRVSYAFAYRVGYVLEGLYRALRIRREPPMTRFLANQLAHDHFFDVSAARRDFGFEVPVSTATGTKRLIEWLRSAGS